MLVLVLGGNSEIGLAAAEQFAQKEKADIILASRNLEKAPGTGPYSGQTL